MAQLLKDEGYPSAYFGYPSDQPIVDSAAAFARNMRALRETFPALHVDVVAHSMGAVVARSFVEGDDYVEGDIEHLILIGPPNQGTPWARWRVLLEAQEHYNLWRHEPDWHWTWPITDGLGEAGADLKPGSRFLTDLNARPRRDGVKYTIVAGAQNPFWRVGAKWAQASADVVPDRASHWWGLRQYHDKLEGFADSMRRRTGMSDGPVPLASTKLDGVDDVVVLAADHCRLYCAGPNGEPPAAWETVKDRLNRR
jgi:pimeloyl-ACP methyl ester carboxylesterase